MAEERIVHPGIIAGGAILGGVLLLGAFWWSMQRQPAPTTAAPSAPIVQPQCADAVKQVQQYKAPGATVPLITSLERQLNTERRPVKIDGWLPPDSAANSCLVYFRVYIGNDRQLLSWSLNHQTGRVEALDAQTKRYSGW